MAWIESHDDIWEHHKTIRLMRLLDISDIEAVGHLQSLWHFVLRNAWRDADLEPWGDSGIEQAARWRGRSGAFVKAMRDVGYLDGAIAHGWLERAGRLVYDRFRKEEERHSADERRKGGGQSKATVPNPTQPNRTVPNQQTLDDFAAFWAAYPKKQGKQEALRAWTKLSPDKDIQDIIMAAVRRQAAVPDAGRDGWKYFKNAQGWLNGRRWEDQEATNSGNASSGGPRNGRIVGAAAPVPGKYDHLG